MKLIFSLCFAALILLPPKRAQSREILLIENLSTPEDGLMLRRILETRFRFPRKLITLKNIHTKCDEKSEAVIHLCLMPEAELRVIKMNQFIVKNSFGIFMNQEITEEETND